MSGPSQARTYLGGHKPTPSSVPDWDADRHATWPATTTAVPVPAGGQAVLIGALMTIPEGSDLAEWIGRSGAGDLHTSYLTHGHADHFSGATTVLERFPAARLVARPAVAEAAREQTSPGYRQLWNSLFPGQMSSEPGCAATDALQPRIRYLLDFHDAAAPCDSATDLIAAVLALHPQLGTPYTLWVAATTNPS